MRDPRVPSASHVVLYGTANISAGQKIERDVRDAVIDPFDGLKPRFELKPNRPQQDMNVRLPPETIGFHPFQFRYDFVMSRISTSLSFRAFLLTGAWFPAIQPTPHVTVNRIGSMESNQKRREIFSSPQFQIEVSARDESRGGHCSTRLI